MNRTTYLCLMLIFTAAFSGCHSESINPLSGLTDAKGDERLLGTWMMKGRHEGEIAYLHVGQGEGSPAAAIWVAHERGERIRVAILKIIPTEIENQNYASVQMVDPKNSEKNEMGYFFIKYSIDQDQKLTLWDIDLKEAVRSGKLKADCGKVTDSTSELRNFVKSADPSELFPPTEPTSVFEKIATH